MRYGAGRRGLAAVVAVIVLTAGWAFSTAPSAAALALGSKCVAVVHIESDSRIVMLKLAHESKWDTNEWQRRPTAEIGPRSFGEWESQGGLFAAVSTR